MDDSHHPGNMRHRDIRVHEETTGLGATLSAILKSPKRSSMTDAAIDELKNRGMGTRSAAATTRATGSLTTPPTGSPFRSRYSTS